MSFSLIEEGLNKVQAVTAWDTLLIKYDHKTHPNEFTCYNINFNTENLLKGTISDMCGTYLKTVQKFEKKVQEYTGFNPKNVVDKLSTTNPIIKDSWTSLIQSINVSDDTTSLKDIKASAFIFAGTYKDEQNVVQNLYLLARKNPIITFKKDRTHIFTSQHNTITETTNPLVQFGKGFDALIYKSKIYMINSNCEGILNMEYSHKKICQKSLDLLEQSNIINDIESYRQFATSGQTPKKFITYDSAIVEKLKLTKWQKQLSSDLKIPINPATKKFDLHDVNHARIFTLAICGKTKLNMFSDGVCEVPSSTPLSLA
ncbi:DUF4868 domain-containing protein [Clostridium omnivorum]|uniref:DUF4868 domain-containing protein n=1 Tax=Clostridium omnivorum TaxID=1604902 RepID=A0ABQ5N7R1_9CLOT|nr:DUF4868 domain-containing protein [Clostridium sp. E14]GLC31134.1 hypothetical protein bsdE14_25440 [Clostridium sp. E14]